MGVVFGVVAAGFRRPPRVWSFGVCGLWFRASCLKLPKKAHLEEARHHQVGIVGLKWKV